MKRLGWLIEEIANIAGKFSGWLVPLMVVLVGFEVFMRYVVGQPPIIADEMSGYMLVAIAYLGMAYTWKEKGHIRVTALVERLPPRIAGWIRLVGLVIALAFTIELSYLTYIYVVISFQRGMASPTWIRTPLQGPQMTLLIGFVLLSLLLIVEVAKAIMDIRSGKVVEGRVR